MWISMGYYRIYNVWSECVNVIKVISRLLKYFSSLVLATSGIDYDVKLWTPTALKDSDMDNANEVSMPLMKVDPSQKYTHIRINEKYFEQNVLLLQHVGRHLSDQQETMTQY